MARTLLVGGQVIDCVSDGAQNRTVVIEGGKIAAVAQPDDVTAGEGDRTIDVSGMSVIPGLWDIHTHLEPVRRSQRPTVPELAYQYAAEATRGLLGSGVVGIRTGGMPEFIDVALREAIERGELNGPQVFAGGHFLTTSAGHLAWSTWSRECDGPVGFVTAVRDQIKAGVDHIKVSLSGGIMGPKWDRPSSSYWLGEELAAVFEMSNLRGYPVMAHATNPATVKAALTSGAHSVEHGYVMDDECVDLFVEKSAWYVPTLCISQLTPSQAESDWEKAWVEDHALRPDLVERADEAAAAHRHWFQKALAAGVKMAVGSDAGPLETAIFQEMELWVKCGATTFETLVAATRNAAQLCGVGDRHGTIEAGKVADIVAVAGNPLHDINEVRNVRLVVKAGEIVTNTIGRG